MRRSARSSRRSSGTACSPATSRHSRRALPMGNSRDVVMTLVDAPDTSATRRVVRAPRGSRLSCKGWQQEAALRMLMNNLDPDVAERPEDLVVYGGTGRAARSWAAFEAIVRALRGLE